MSTIAITLTAYNMDPRATEEDFDAWHTFVCNRIDDAVGFEVDYVGQYQFVGELPDRDEIVGGTEEQRESVRRWLLNEGWEAFCAEMDARRRALDPGPDPSALVTVGLRGGDAADSRAAVCVDRDRGLVTSGEEWAALVRVDRVLELLKQTGAALVRGPEVWGGERFGDGNGGTVERKRGRVVGKGLNASALAEAMALPGWLRQPGDRLGDRCRCGLDVVPEKRGRCPR